MTWSFSKLETYHACPHAFFLSYLSGQDIIRQGNAFSDYGTFAHTLLEKWAKDELGTWQLESEWESGYRQAVTHSFPPYMKNYSAKAYEEGRQFFSSFSGFPGLEIVSAEKLFEVNVGRHKFTGIADLVLRDELTGGLVVIDHKTKGAASMKKDYSTFIHQLYIYALHVKQDYGEYPELIGFNMIKPRTMIWEAFDPAKLETTIQWADSTIETIENDMDFNPCPDNHRCRFICDVRGACPHCPIYTR